MFWAQSAPFERRTLVVKLEPQRWRLRLPLSSPSRSLEAIHSPFNFVAYMSFNPDDPVQIGAAQWECDLDRWPDRFEPTDFCEGATVSGPL
jgi:hypothetical protein